MTDRVGWVESPLQLINAIEYACLADEQVDIYVRSGVPTLDDVAAALQPALPESVSLHTGVASALRSPAVTSRNLLAGDIYSGQLRAVISLGLVKDVVAVDDGSAMLTLGEQLGANEVLRRPAVDEGTVMRRMGELASKRLHKLGATGHLELFTAYADTDSMRSAARAGARVVANRYEWTKSTDVVLGKRLQGHVVVGSAMVADGLVKAEAYRAWLAEAVSGGATYVPHRRETPEALADYATLPGFSSMRPDLALEIVLAHSPGLRKVTSMPSSVIATLRRILPARIEFVLVPVPDSWWTDEAGEGFRTMVRTIEES